MVKFIKSFSLAQGKYCYTLYRTTFYAHNVNVNAKKVLTYWNLVYFWPTSIRMRFSQFYFICWVCYAITATFVHTLILLDRTSFSSGPIYIWRQYSTSKNGKLLLYASRTLDNLRRTPYGDWQILSPRWQIYHSAALVLQY